MTAVGPLSLNILAPAMPGLIVDASAPRPAPCSSRSRCILLGMAISQLVLGPLSDRFGRRPVMLAGLVLTVVASFAALATTSIAGLIVARTLQAFGATAGIVIGRAVIRDLYDRDRAASMIGWVTMAMVVAPMIAPLIGGALDTALGWQAIFVFVGLFAAARARLGGVRSCPRRARSRPAKASRASSRDAASLLTDRSLHRLRAGRGVQFGDVLHLHRRRAACRGHHHAPLVGRIRHLVRDPLARLHGGKFRRRPLVGAIRRRRDDPRRRRHHGAGRGGRHRPAC